MADRAGRPALVVKIVDLHEAFDAARLPHAFGGALALAWCTGQARATIDIDVNVFVPASEAPLVFDALPRGVAWSATDVGTCVRDGQVRVWWDTTPLDLFTNTTGFHDAAADRAVEHQLAGVVLPFLSCSDLAVFKAFFDRTKDWADLEEMVAAGTLDVDRVLGVLVHYLGTDDHRLARLRALVV